MKFLPKRFGKSYIRKWIEAKNKELTYSTEINAYNLFVGMIYAIRTFMTHAPGKGKILKNVVDIGLHNIYKHFSNDASLFEVDCYLYCFMDRWLFQNKPHLREEISGTFEREFFKLFTEALKIDNIPDIFEERFNTYTEITRNSKSNEETLHK